MHLTVQLLAPLLACGRVAFGGGPWWMQLRTVAVWPERAPRQVGFVRVLSGPCRCSLQGPGPGSSALPVAASGRWSGRQVLSRRKARLQWRRAISPNGRRASTGAAAALHLARWCRPRWLDAIIISGNMLIEKGRELMSTAIVNLARARTLFLPSESWAWSDSRCHRRGAPPLI